jgi:phosphoesterase RecJ-like protein
MHEPRVGAPPPAWAEIGAALERCRSIVISTHVNPDGDGLGAELGLWAYLRARGKDARIVNPDPLPDRYTFLAREAEFEAYAPAVHDPVIDRNELVVVLDISKWERLDGLGEKLRRSAALKVCIDHHPFEDNGMADLYGVDLTAAATGQLVYEMIRDRGHEVDRRMALGFYVSILTDTGSFRFSNSDPRAHRVAAELLTRGLDPNDLYEQVYGNSSLPRLRLMGIALSTMRVEEGGRLVFLVIPRAEVVRTGAHPADTEGFVDVARTVRGSEGVALLLEREDGTVKLSLRSKGRINVNRAASSMGGGGHIYASGATLPGPLEAAVARVRDALREELRRLDAGGAS